MPVSIPCTKEKYLEPEPEHARRSVSWFSHTLASTSVTLRLILLIFNLPIYKMGIANTSKKATKKRYVSVPLEPQNVPSMEGIIVAAIFTFLTFIPIERCSVSLICHPAISFSRNGKTGFRGLGLDNPVICLPSTGRRGLTRGGATQAATTEGLVESRATASCHSRPWNDELVRFLFVLSNNHKHL